MRIELTTSAWKAEVLPLNYTREYLKYGAPDRSRTHNLLIRSQTLYPIELRALINGAEDRNRTGTVVTYRRILSPVRLPVPPPRHIMERKTRFELATPTLARWCSTTELLPHVHKLFLSGNENNGAGEGSRTPTPCGARS